MPEPTKLSDVIAARLEHMRRMRSRERFVVCVGCDVHIDQCGPTLWASGRTCCPDCTHRVEAPSHE